MNKTISRSCFLLSLTLTSMVVVAADQNSNPESKLIGTWRLKRTEQHLTDGTVRPNPAYGPNGIGYLMYDNTHHMCVFLTDPERGLKPSVTAALNAKSADSSSATTATVPSPEMPAAYCGTWSLDSKASAIIHKVEMDVDGRSVGVERTRRFEIQGNRLRLRPEPKAEGMVDYFLEFERVR